MPGLQPSEIILPTGETGYLNPYSGTYSTNRDYARRMQRNYTRGISQAEARGHKPNIFTGETESQRRRRLAEERGTTVQDETIIRWNARYPGMDRNWYRRMYSAYIREINARSSPGVRIGPDVVYSQLVNAPMTGHNTEWVEERLLWRMSAMQQYQDEDSNEIGFQLFIQNQLDPTPPEWWYYH